MRREYRGGARAATLSQPLGGSTADLTIFCSDLSNWPTGINDRPFFVVIGRETPLEEKILCSSRSGNVLTIFNSGLVNGRGADDTNIAAHSNGSVIEHIFTATDANEANLHLNSPNIHIASNQEAITISSSTSRPSNPSVNDIIFETDTRSLRYWNGTLWARVGSGDGIFDPFFLIGA
jgi:hypothetical protein